jgi:hypothetical protein
LLYQHHKGNASATSSEQVIASSTAWRPRLALSAAQRPVSLASGRGDLSRLRLNVMPASDVPVLVVDLTHLPVAPQTSYYVDLTISIAVDIAAVATAVESSVAAVLTSAAAATTLLGGDLKYRLSGYSIAIIAAVAVLAAILSCSRWISDPEPKVKTGPNLPDGLRPLPKLSTSVCLTTRMARLVLVLLLCPGVMSTTLDSGPILIHQVGMHAGNQSLATKEAVREAKFHKAEAAAEDPFLFKHRLQYHDAASNKLTYFEYSARRHDHVLMLDEMNISSCALEVAGGQIQKVHLTSRDHDGLIMNVTAGTFLSHLLAPLFIVLLRTAFGHMSQGRYLQVRSNAWSKEANTCMASRYKNRRSQILMSHSTRVGSKRF